MKKLFTLITAMLASAASMTAQDVEYGPNVNPNSDCEGADFSYYAAKPNKLADGSANSTVFTGETLTEETGVSGEAGSRYVSVLAAAGAANDWDSQFWIVIPDNVDVGEHVKVKFSYKADFMDSGLTQATVGTQAHGAPGDYHHWACIGDVTFTSEWQIYEYDMTISGDMMGSNGFHSVAFNLNQPGHDINVTYMFDNLEVYLEKQDETLVKYWKPIIQNGDLEGDDLGSFIFRLRGQGDREPDVVEGVGYEETRGIQMDIPAKVSDAWDHQFFIKMNEPIPAGDMIKIEFDYKASEAPGTAIDTQSHGQGAGSYNHYTAVGSITFTEEWKHYSYTQSVSSDQSKEDNPYQYIAFNMAVTDHPVTYWMDNITVKHQVLVPAGENPAKLELDEYMESLRSKYNDMSLSNDKVNDAIREEFYNAYNDCLDLGEDDDYDTFLSALRAAEGKYTSSMKDYNSLLNHVNLLGEKIELADAMGEDYADLKASLEEIKEKLDEQYNECQWGRDEIKAAIAENDVMAIIAPYVAEHLKAGDNVTILVNNPSYSFGNTGWTSGATVNYGAAEAYHKTFDVNQTLNNMPKGVYTIKVNGFQRLDNEVVDLNAMVYANNAAKFLVDRDDMDTYAPEGDAPNDMASSAAAFAEGYYPNELSTMLVEDGSLKFGIKGTDNNYWVIWDNFEVIYQGANNYADVIKDQIEYMNSVAVVLELELNNETLDKEFDVALKAGEVLNNIQNATEAECEATIASMLSMIDEMNAIAAVVRDIQKKYDDFTLAYDLYYEDAADDVKARADEAMKAVENYVEQSNEQLAVLGNELNVLSSLIKINKDATSATEEAPFDFTYLFGEYVDNFDNYEVVGANANYPGWGGSGFGTGGGTAGPCGEKWNQTSGFNTYIEFSQLPSGNYILTCDGAARNGANNALTNDWDIFANDSINDNPVYLYVTTSAETVQTPMHNIVEGKLTKDDARVQKWMSLYYQTDDEGNPAETITGNCAKLVVDEVEYLVPDQLFTADLWIREAGQYKDNTVKFSVPADGQGKIRLGVERPVGKSNDWCFVDNFKLLYLGGGAPQPDAVENVQVAPVVNAIYTISGVRVSNTKRPGIYIVNGKKMLVK